MMIHLVDIEHKTQTQDPVTGEATETWTKLHRDVYCDIKPLSVRDFIQSRADQSEISVRIVIDAFTGLDPTMRLVGVCGCHRGKIYNPEGFLEDPGTGQEYITVPCSQGVNNG